LDVFIYLFHQSTSTLRKQKHTTIHECGLNGQHRVMLLMSSCSLIAFLQKQCNIIQVHITTYNSTSFQATHKKGQ